MPAMEIYLIFYWLGTVLILQFPIKAQSLTIAHQLVERIYANIHDQMISYREIIFYCRKFWWLPSTKNVYTKKISETGDWRHEGRFSF